MADDNTVIAQEHTIQLTVPGQLNDVSVARVVLEHMAKELRENGTASRELSLAITKIDEAYLWLGEAVRRY